MSSVCRLLAFIWREGGASERKHTPLHQHSLFLTSDQNCQKITYSFFYINVFNRVERD